MIGVRDTITLAHTKIRSKRLRLLMTTIVSGLVFGVMAGATVLVDGASHSLAAFARKNLDGRFLVQGSPNYFGGPSSLNPNDAALIAEVQKYHVAYIADRKAAAKRLGVEYDERTEVLPYVEDTNPQVPPEYRKSVNFSSPAWQRYAKDHPVQASAKDEAAFRALVEPLGAREVYVPRDLSHLRLGMLLGGREDLTQAPSGDPPKALQTAIGQGSFTIVDDTLVKPFLARGQDSSAGSGVPVLITADDALVTFKEALGLSSRPKDPTAQVRWFQRLRDRVTGQTFVSCYRNEAELVRVEQTRAQLAEVAANRGNRDYVAPELQLALPTTPCGMVTVTKDTRSAETKKAQEAVRAFEQEFNPQPEPRAELVTFQVVGLLPSPAPSTSGVDAVIGGLVGTNYGFGAVIPKDSLAALPEALRHDSLFALPAPETVDPFMGPMTQQNFIASFPRVEQARAAVADNSCMMNWTPRCETMSFSLQTYGTNYLAVDDIVRAARPVIIALLAIAFAIATIIIWAMMGRVIADSRRETAVFRAIGAKRSDIVSVYLTYSLWVALRIVVFAAALGMLIAGTIHVLYAERATHMAQLAYAVFTPDPTFGFIGFRSPVLWLILGGIVAMSLVAITPPLLRNIRRNPIRDMRDE
ncbi:MAG: ABC transporter permease [Dermatophilaceae bacterium]|jgi:hypothetical protein